MNITAEQKDGLPKSAAKLPSARQINDVVTVSFGDESKFHNCIVNAVKFSLGKVRYDLLVPAGDGYEILSEIDSVFVS